MKFHSEQILEALLQKIESSNGAISFAQFMEFALYEPGLGYYVSGCHKLGAGGDFTTAPLISPLFSACLGNHCAALGAKAILEFGAGTGDMAIGVLQRLASLDALPSDYLILEVSPDLRERQQYNFANRLPTDIYQRIDWLNRLPDSFEGVVLANEVLDAMPVERIRLRNGQWEQQMIGFDRNELSFHYDPIHNPELKRAVNRLPIDLPDGYSTEVNTWIEPWIRALADCLIEGFITLIDYGFLRETYYHPERHMGTLKCYFQHQANDNPLLRVGLQDITAHVDFTTVGESAESCGLIVSEFCNQTQFLIDCGITDLLGAVTDRQAYESLLPGMTQLTSPHEMGELFKVMVLRAKRKH